MSFVRPADARVVHFTCDGSLELLAQIPLRELRVGDTASGTLSSGELAIVRVVRVDAERSGWDVECAWTEKAAKACIEAADVLVLLVAPEGPRRVH